MGYAPRPGCGQYDLFVNCQQTAHLVANERDIDPSLVPSQVRLGHGSLAGTERRNRPGTSAYGTPRYWQIELSKQSPVIVPSDGTSSFTLVTLGAPGRVSWEGILEFRSERKGHLSPPVTLQH